MMNAQKNTLLPPVTIIFAPGLGVLGAITDADLLQARKDELDEREVPYDLYEVDELNGPLPAFLPGTEIGCEECAVGWCIFNADLDVLPGEDQYLGQVQRCDTCATLSESAAVKRAQAAGFAVNDEGEVTDASQVEAPEQCYACGYSVEEGPACESCGYPYGKRKVVRIMLDDLGPFECERLTGERWNGFEMPLFTREQGESLILGMMADPHRTVTRAFFDIDRDAFVFESTEDGGAGPEVFERLSDGLFSIGGGAWVWSKA